MNEFLRRELAENGYSGVEVRNGAMKTDIIIMATRTQDVLGEKGRKIRELTAVVQKRFNFKVSYFSYYYYDYFYYCHPQKTIVDIFSHKCKLFPIRLQEGTVNLFAEKVSARGLCAITQCESLRYKLIGGLAVRRACYSVLRCIMEAEAMGCEVVVSGKLRGQRAKSMKFVEGLMIHSGDPTNHYVETAVRHVLLKQGVLGIKVKIMHPFDPQGKRGPVLPLPDKVSVTVPKYEDDNVEIRSDNREETVKPPTVL